MSNYTHETIPTQLTRVKGTSLVREVFKGNFWMSGLAMLKYIPRSFRVKQVDGMAFFTEEKRDEFSGPGSTDYFCELAPVGNDERLPNAASPESGMRRFARLLRASR